MKSRATSRKIIIFMLLTAFLFCGVQGVGYSGELFWGLGEALGGAGEAVGAGLGAAGEGIGAGFGAVGEGLGAAGEGLGAAWEAFDAVGEAFGVHPVEIIATGGISVILRYIPIPDANVVGQVRGASNIFVIPDGGPIGLVVSGSVHFWDSHTEQFAAPLIHGAPIFNFVVSPDSGLLATTSEGGNVQLWSRNAASVDSPWVPSGQQLDMSIAGYTTWAQLKLEPKIQILSTAFSPDGEILAGGSARGTVRLWNAMTGSIRTTLRGHTDSVTSIAFSPDGGLLATASADGTVRLWNPGTGDLHATLSGHTSSVLSVAFSPATSLLASASLDGTVRLWNPSTGAQEDTLDHESPVLDIAFSPDGDVLATANINGSVRLWDPETKRVQALLGHGSPVTTVAFGRDKHSVITGSRDGLIRQWEVWDVADSGPEILTASTASPLTESTIHGSVVTLSLNRLAYAPARGIRDPVKVSDIAGETVDTSNTWRVNDTELTVELEFNGDIDTNANITFTVEANAVAGYFGPALTAQIPVTAVTETVVASTASPLTEATLDGSVVILTLRGRTYARSSFDIREALSVSGVRAVTVERFDVDRVSDTEVAVELEFKGDIDEDAILTFTVGADAIAGYGGSAITAQLPVTAFTESVTASAASPLTEASLDGSVVTLTLDGGTYARSRIDIGRAVKVSGVPGVTVEWSDVDRLSDTEMRVELGFNGDIDTDAVLTFSVGAGAIAGYGGGSLTAQLPVTASIESVTVATASPLTERTLDGNIVTLTLNGRGYAESIFDIRDGVTVSGVDGVTIPWHQPDRKSDTEITMTLEFNGDLDDDATLTFTVGTDAIAGYNGPALTVRLPVSTYIESVSASTATPLKEATLEGSVVTLTLSGCTYEQSIRDAVKLSGIDGATVNKSNTKRVSDTEATVGIKFNGDMNAAGSLTLTIGAGAIEGYRGTALTTQLPVTASTESLAASTPSPLTEASLNGSVVTLTLVGRSYAQSIGDGVKVSGIAGVTIPWRGLDRKSDTEITVELEFDGDIDTDSTLTFSVGADAITGYGGTALTAQLPVTAYTESVTVSTASPLTEATLAGSIVTLMLNGRAYAESIWDVRRAVKVSGTAGVTVSTSRVNDTEVTVKLEFNGDIDADTTLTFSVGADGIAGYNGPALTAQLPVTASIESVAASTTSPLAEATLEGSVVTLTLSGRNYVSSSWDISRALTITGIDGVTKDSVRRISDTEATVELEFNGDFDADATLTFTVGADAIAGYGGPALSAQVVVTGETESIAASTAAPLTEVTLDGSVVTLTLNGRVYAQSVWDIRGAVKVSGIAGVTVSIRRVSDTEVTVELEFNGDIDADASLTFSVGKDAIANYNGPALAVQLPVTASTEAVVASTSFPLTEPRLNGSVVTLTLAGRVYAPVWDIRDAVKVSGIAGITIPRHQTDRRSVNEVTVKLEFNGNIDADATLTFSVGADAITGYSGLALSAQLPVTASTESVTASTASPLTEATLEGSVVTLTLSGCTFERSIFDIRDAVTLAGIDGATMPWHQPDRQSDTKVTIELEFDGDMEADGSLTFTVGADAIANYNGPALTAQLPVTASKEDMLAANFPNPFNPETWIPYQLATDAVVTLTIHALDGQLVQRLGLGYQPARARIIAAAEPHIGTAKTTSANKWRVASISTR